MSRKIQRVQGFVVSGRRGSYVVVVRGNTAYARRYKKPRDPQTEQQCAQRGRFVEAVQTWRALGDEDKARYNERAKKMGRAGYNLFMAEFMATARLKK